MIWHNIRCRKVLFCAATLLLLLSVDATAESTTNEAETQPPTTAEATTQGIATVAMTTAEATTTSEEESTTSADASTTPEGNTTEAMTTTETPTTSEALTTTGTEAVTTSEAMNTTEAMTTTEAPTTTGASITPTTSSSVPTSTTKEPTSTAVPSTDAPTTKTTSEPQTTQQVSPHSQLHNQNMMTPIVVFCVLMGVLAIYFITGITVRYRRGLRRCPEVLPNYKFWRSFGYAVMFCISCGRWRPRQGSDTAVLPSYSFEKVPMDMDMDTDGEEMNEVHPAAFKPSRPSSSARHIGKAD